MSDKRVEPGARSSVPITAIVYAESARAAATMRRMVEALVKGGASVAGYIQRDVEKPGRSRCDMLLENIKTGRQLPISEDRGPGARGCQLDVHGLTAAMVELQIDLQASTDLLVLNKFGKSEAEGGGFRPLIAGALEHGIPVVIGVSWRNVEAWRVFAGEHAKEVLLDDLEAESNLTVLYRLGLVARPQGAAGTESDPSPRASSTA